MKSVPKPKPPKQTRREGASGFILFALVAAAVLLSLWFVKPPRAVSADAAPTEFSSGRAVQHLQAIADRPHPIGSAAIVEDRDYILRQLTGLGLAPEIQKTSVVKAARNSAVAADVQNITALLKGQETGGKVVLLVAHYDSVPNSPGASDDGSGVASLLETIRALKAGPPLRNDVLCLFTEGEEIGLMGAKGFVEDNSLAKRVGLVLNFEARGSGGPVFMFETSDGNGRMIEEFAGAVKHPFASSLMSAIYKLLPNDTDFSIFRRAGFPGLNFAFIGGVTRYHSQRDSLEMLDERSVQHQGAYALSLARQFGNARLDDIRGDDVVYFDVLGLTLFKYSSRWILPLAALVTLLFGATWWLGWRKGYVSPAGSALGFLIFLLSFVCSAPLASLIWGGVTAVHSDFTPFTANNIFMVAFLALVLTITTSLYLLLSRWVSFGNLSVGALFCWLLLAWLSAVRLPGASFLFLWPLFFSLVGLALGFNAPVEKTHSIKRLSLIFLFALPGIFLLTQTAYSLFLGLGMGSPTLVLVLPVLLIGLLIPLMQPREESAFKWALPTAAFSLFLILIVVGNVSRPFDRNEPQSNTLLYVSNADTGESFWVSPDRRVDEWTSQFFERDAERKPLPELFANARQPFISKKAPSLNLEKDSVEMISDTTTDGIRTVDLKIKSARQPRLLSITLEPKMEILSAQVNGRQLYSDENRPSATQERGWVLTYYAVPAEGFNLKVSMKSGEPFKVRVMSESEGLPQIPNLALKPRPEYLIPSQLSDTTRVTGSYTLGGDAMRPADNQQKAEADDQQKAALR